jgi:hypothetical protein
VTNQSRVIHMDLEQAAAFAQSTASITTSALAGLGEAGLANVMARLQAGATLYLHVQMVPVFVVALVLDPAPNDPAQKPIELGRWADEVPAKSSLNS